MLAVLRGASGGVGAGAANEPRRSVTSHLFVYLGEMAFGLALLLAVW